MTNFEKLMRWDADYYKSLSDDDCIVCLSEKQIYLIGQMIEQMTWYKTRWTGDVSELDFDRISSDLNYRISERMTCNQLQEILNRVTQIEITLGDIQNPADDFDVNITVINDNYTDAALAEIAIQSETCLTADKDALYGAISQLIRYMHQKNVDFFEELSQLGNISDQIDRLKTSIGSLNSVPLANALDFITFYIEELLQEYEATVDEELLQTTICDLFCIAVNSGCKFNFYDVYDYFNAKVEPSFSNATTTFLDLVQFAIFGSFSGNGYYYFATYFQLAMAGLKQLYLGITDVNAYGYQFLAGKNSPDNDWSIFCVDCPEQYRLWTWDFAQGLGDFTLINGELSGGRIHAPNATLTNDILLSMPLDDTWRIISAKMYGERINGLAHGSQDNASLIWRVTPGSDTGSFGMPTGGFLPNTVFEHCGVYTSSPFHITGYEELSVRLGVSDNGGLGEIYLDKIEIVYRVDHGPVETRITEDSNICD